MMKPSRLVAAAALVLLASPAAAQSPPPAISVSGEATVSVAPDLAQVDGGVTSEAKTARELYNCTGHKEGVGLASTRSRLSHLYGDNYVFTMRGAPNEGVHVTVVIPFTHTERMAAD